MKKIYPLPGSLNITGQRDNMEIIIIISSTIINLFIREDSPKFFD